MCRVDGVLAFPNLKNVVHYSPVGRTGRRVGGVDHKSLEVRARSLPVELVDHEASHRARGVTDDADDARRGLSPLVDVIHLAAAEISCIYGVEDDVFVVSFEPELGRTLHVTKHHNSQRVKVGDWGSTILQEVIVSLSGHF